MTLQRIGTSIRTFDVPDFDQVFAIESKSRSPKSEQWLIEQLKIDQNEIIVIERSRRVVGFCLFEERKHSLRIIRFGVLYPLCGLGRMLMENVQRRCLTWGHNCVDVSVDETDVPTQLFLSRVGFTAIGVSDGSIKFRHLKGHQC